MHEAGKKSGILIIDHSLEYREIMKKSLEGLPDLTVMATSPNNHIGSMKALDLKPEVILVDAEVNDLLPDEFTRNIHKKLPDTTVILTVQPNARPEIVERTLRGLESGAFDIVVKPPLGGGDEVIERIKRRLLLKIHGCLTRKYTAFAKNVSGTHKTEKAAVDLKDKILANKSLSAGKGKFRVVAIGISTGGPRALLEMVPHFSVVFPLPVVIVLHLPKMFTGSMANELNAKSGISVVEARDGDMLKAGNVYLAEGGSHLVVKRGDDGKEYLHYDDGPPENGCKPSVDVLFRSLAEVYRGNVLAVLCTGMGEDGTRGLAVLKGYGARAIAQDRETSIVWGMPGSAVQAGLIDEVLPLQKIVDRINELVSGGGI